MLFSWLRRKRSALTVSKPSQSGEQGPSIDLLVQQAIGLHQAEQLDAAATVCREILLRAPMQFDALHMLGVMALTGGALAQAQALLRSAQQANPQDAAVNYHLGVVLVQMGRAADSIAPLRRAVSLDPASAIMCGLLAASLYEVGDMLGAQEAYAQAAQLSPHDAQAHSSLGAIQIKNGQLHAAVASLTRAIAIDPTMLPAIRNLASTQLQLGHFVEALDLYAKLIAMADADPTAHFDYGHALITAGYTNRAIEQYQRTLELEPEFARAHWALAMSHLKPFYDDVGDIDASRLAFADALSALDTWFTPGRVAQGGRDAVGSIQPFYLAYNALDNRPLLERYGRLCSKLMASKAPTTRPKSEPLDGPRKLRIGFASAFVKNHSVWNAITKGWITHLDPTRFEVHVFNLAHCSDSETEFAREEVTNFVETAYTLDEWIESILEEKLDALIYPDIGMHPLCTQLATLRLAPVQAATWGHPDTTGLPEMDLFLSGDLLEPTDGDRHYTEKLVRLPNLGVCVESLSPVAVEPDLADLGLPTNEELLLCPGQLFKYSPQDDAVWVTLGARLRQHGTGRLVFFRNPQTALGQRFEERLRQAFKTAHVDFDATVCMVPILPRQLYYGLMQHAALMLDTIGFSGFNTALQCVECGLPLLAFDGAFMRGRLASGLLRRMGLDPWIATSHSEFVDKAMLLIANPELRRSLSQTIGASRAILFNDASVVRALEKVLVDAIASAQKNQGDRI